MKQTGRKILSVFLTLALCLGLMPGLALPVRAATGDVYCGGVKLVNRKYYPVSGNTLSDAQDTAPASGGYVNLDGNTLTLNNVSLSGDYSAQYWNVETITVKAVIFSDGADLTIHLVGDNTLAEPDNDLGTNRFAAYGRNCGLTFTGEEGASLNASGVGCAIYATNAISLQTANVTATATGMAYQSTYGNSGAGYGMKSEKGSVTVESGTVTATGGNTSYGVPGGEAPTSCGVWARTALTVKSGAKLIAIGGTTTSDFSESYGVFIGYNGTGERTYHGGPLTVEAGGTLYANTNDGTTSTAGAAPYQTAGIRCSAFTSGGTVVAFGGNASSYRSYGIYTFGNVNVTGGSVTATAGEAAGFSCGFYFYGGGPEMNLSGGTVTVTGGTATETYSYGLYNVEGTVTMTGGTLIATGGQAPYGSYGVYNHVMNLQGGTVNAIGGEVTDTGNVNPFERDSCGIFNNTRMTITDTVANVSGGKIAKGVSSGIRHYTSQGLTITNSTVTAVGGAATTGYSMGIANTNSNEISMSGSVLEASGDTAGSGSYGIWKSPQITRTSQNAVIYQGLTQAINARYVIDEGMTATVSTSYDGTSPTELEAGLQITSDYKYAKMGHAHSFANHAATGSTITAVCSETGCTLPESKASLTISAPLHTQVNDGKSPDAVIDDPNGIKKGGAVIAYYNADESGDKTGDALASAPEGEGRYWAQITMGGATAHVVYTISAFAALNNSTRPVIKKGTESIGSTAPVVGDELTATTTAAPIGTWQWYADGQPISGATGINYTVTAADVGKVITVKATQPKDSGGAGNPASNVTVSSAATAKVEKKAGPAAPASALAAGFEPNYITEAFTISESYEASTGENDDGVIGGSSLTDALDGTGKIYIRQQATDDTKAGAWLEVSLVARPDAPTGLTTTEATNGSTADGKINGTTTAMEYKLKGSTGNWITARATETLVIPGTYLVRVKATDAAPHGESTEVTVGSKEIILTDGQKPTALTNLEYTGSAQKLINEPAEALPVGATEMQYVIGTDAATPPTNGWDTSIPTGINAGTYYVWYMVKADSDHTDSNAFCVKVTISPKTVEPDIPVETEKTVPMYRLFNKGTLEHLYTDSKRERDVLSGSGWIYEGIAWYAPEKSKTPVYRLYNPILKDHHYTNDVHERDVLSTKHGWIYEGIGWYSDDAKTVPIYRRFYPFITSGSHHYTNSLNEAKHLVKVGWIDEGIGWYGAAEK